MSVRAPTSQRALQHNAPKMPPRQPKPGEEVWRLTHAGGRVQSCELRDNSRVGAGWDVMLLEAGEPLFSRRCLDEAFARRVAEPYTPTTAKSVLKPQYFAQGKLRWSDVGLPGCQVVAEHLRTGGHDFTVLDVAQLLKHMLALARTGNRWTLCCLWYEVPGPAADAHRDDLQTFSSQIGGDTAHFVALTYQEFFVRMLSVVGADNAEYMSYLRDRYLSETR